MPTSLQLLDYPLVWWPPCSRRSSLTLSDEVNDVVGVEAELVSVLGIVGVQCPALGYLRLGLGLGLGSAPCRCGAACHQPTSTVGLQRKAVRLWDQAELSVPTPGRQSHIGACTEGFKSEFYIY